MECALCGKEIKKEICVNLHDNRYHYSCYQALNFIIDNTEKVREILENIDKYKSDIQSDFAQLDKAVINKGPIEYHNKRLHGGWSREPMVNFVDNADRDFKDMNEVKEYLDQRHSDKKKLFFYSK